MATRFITRPFKTPEAEHHRQLPLEVRRERDVGQPSSYSKGDDREPIADWRRRRMSGQDGGAETQGDEAGGASHHASNRMTDARTPTVIPARKVARI